MLPIGWLCPYPAQEMLALLRLFFLQEFVDDLFYVAVLAVYGVVQLTHIVVGYFSGEFVEGLFYFWMGGERFPANDGHGFVGREIMFVVVENDKVECGNKAVGGVSRDQVDLPIFQGASE